MSAWNHHVCDACWPLITTSVLGNPHVGEPVRLKEEFREVVTCCFCERPTASGIFVRADPLQVTCRGLHDAEDVDATD